MKLDKFSDYEIFPDEGKIWSLKSNRFIGSPDKKQGYLHVALTSDNGEIWKTTVHRVIWTAVHGEIPDNMVINHKDENPMNCAICNLEICSIAYNNNYGTRNERISEKLTGRKRFEFAEQMTNRSDLSKQVAAYENGELVMVFQSTMEAKRNGYNQGAVSACARGERNSYKGFQWKYLEKMLNL